MQHEILLALMGHCGRAIRESVDGQSFVVGKEVPFLCRADRVRLCFGNFGQFCRVSGDNKVLWLSCGRLGKFG